MLAVKGGGSAESALVWGEVDSEEREDEMRKVLKIRPSRLVKRSLLPDEWTSVSFEEAERRETIHYRQAVEAALLVRPLLSDRAEQLLLR